MKHLTEVMKKISDDLKIQAILNDGIERDDPIYVAFAMDAGVDITENDNYPIRLAAKKGSLKIAQMLLEAGADLTANLCEAIVNASNNDDVEMLTLFSEYLRKDNAKSDFNN